MSGLSPSSVRSIGRRECLGNSAKRKGRIVEPTQTEILLKGQLEEWAQ